MQSSWLQSDGHSLDHSSTNHVEKSPAIAAFLIDFLALSLRKPYEESGSRVNHRRSGNY
jgi:hypothetical protein